MPGGIENTAREVDARGGKGVAVRCDHRDDAQVAALFEQVEKETGRLDLLVNNVFSIHRDLVTKGGFWEKPLSLWDDMIAVGLRSHYVASCYAAPLMVRAKSGLIANTSSYGAQCYFHATAYGVGKAGVDKLAMDGARELKPYNVAFVSLWLGLVKTELVVRGFEQKPDMYPAEFMQAAESPEFSGRVIAALFADPKRMEKSGRVWIAAELAQEYGVKDVGGEERPSFREFLASPVDPAPAMIT